MLRQLALILSIFVGSMASAKELSSRLGVGYRNSMPIELPSISAIYYANSELAWLGALGVDTQDQASRFGIQVGLRKIIFKEENLNFFMGGALGMLSAQTLGETDSGFVLDGIVGSEFFIPGIDSLGFSVETGVSVANIRTVRFRTMADSFTRAGIVFYF